MLKEYYVIVESDSFGLYNNHLFTSKDMAEVEIHFANIDRTTKKLEAIKVRLILC
jgi:hypothetical protein